MANCSFIKATDARSRSRNDTLIWTEICEIQKAILAAMDAGTSFSTIVNDGTPFTSLNAITAATLDTNGSGYTISAAEGLTGVNPDNGATYTNGIYANGTGGSGAAITPVVTGTTITSITVDNGGSGYTPVSATASVGVLYDLLDAQGHADYNNVGSNGSFVGGDDYAVGEVITLSDSSAITVVAVSATGVVSIAGDTEANFDDPGNITENGTFTGGNANPFTGYLAGQTITMNDGTVILVDAVDGNGDVTQFTIQSSSTASFAADTTLVQASTTGTGAGFTLTLDGNNETAVGVVTQFTVSSAGAVPFRYPATLAQTSATGIGVGFTLSPNTNNVQPVTTGSGALLTPIVTNGVITNVVINNGGSLYLGQEPIVFSHPSGTSASAYVSAIDGTGAVTGITIVNGGSGYEIASPLVAVSHPSGSGFVGVVNTSGGVITSVTVQDGGFGYQTLYPTVTISDATGSGAQINVTSLGDGVLINSDAIASIQLVSGGSGYSQTPSVLIYNSNGAQNSTATISLTVGSNTYGTNPTDYYSVLSGQATNAVIADQIQYVLDYFTALGYNIRAQVNPSTGDTMQWQIIW